MLTNLKTIAIACLLTMSAVTGGQAAEEAPATPKDGASDNFSLAPATGSQFRIDRRDGTVSLCQQTDGQWVCKLVADDRNAYENRLAELEDENARLEARVTELERKLQDQSKTDPLLGPSELKKFDEFLDLSDRMFRHFFDMVEDLKRDHSKPI